MEKYTNSRLDTSERPFQKQSRVRHLRFLLPRLGLVLLAGSITVVMAVQPAYGTIDAETRAATNSNKAAVSLANNEGTLKATLNSLVLVNAPAGVHLIIHIHAKNTSLEKPGLCKGPILFAIKAKPGEEEQLQVGDDGKFSTKNLAFTVNKDLAEDQKALLKASDFNTWLINVHNADKINPADKKPVSIVCGPITVAQGTASLKPDPKPAAAKPAVA